MNKNLSFSVSAQRIELTESAMLVAGTVNEYTARFTFDAAWDGYQRTAVFACNTVEREQLLTDDACTVPWEVLISNGYLRVGVYGTKDGSRLPTIWTERRLYINPGAGPTQEAADPSPTLVEQLLGRMGDLAALMTEDKSSLVAAINEIFASGGGGGASITDAAINEDGHLIITLSTGTTIDAGYAVGPAGAPGAAGKDGQDGAPGKDGVAGAPGKDGVGIQSVDQTTTSTDDGGTNIITVTKSDGSSSTFQVRNGSKGSTGPAGADGAPGKDGLGVPVATAEDAGKVPVVQEDGTYGLANIEDVPVYLGTIPVSQDTALYLVAPVKDYKKVIIVKERTSYNKDLNSYFYIELYQSENQKVILTSFSKPGYSFAACKLECFSNDFAVGEIVYGNNAIVDPTVSGMIPHSSVFSNNMITTGMPIDIDSCYYGFHVANASLAFDGSETVHVWGWKR